MSNDMIQFVSEGINRHILIECESLNGNCYSGNCYSDSNCGGRCICKDAKDALIVLNCRDLIRSEIDYNEQFREEKRTINPIKAKLYKIHKIVSSMLCSMDEQEKIITEAIQCEDCLKTKSPLENTLYRKFPKMISKKCKHK